MKNCFKIIYSVLGVVLVLLLIFWLILDIFSLKINQFYFTWNKENCLQGGGGRIFKDLLCAERPPLFRGK